MNTAQNLRHAVDNYLAERRQLGFQAKGSELRRFARYADSKNYKGPISAELQISWAHLHVRKTTAYTGTRRLRTLRPFMRYYRQFEPESVVLDPCILGPHSARQTPHIYTAGELSDLLHAARALDGDAGLRGVMYSTLFGLIAATGLRLSESINLIDADVDLTQGQLRVKETKFCKSRLLPLHNSTREALSVWREKRNRHWPDQHNQSFFVGHRGTALKMRNVEWVFDGLRRSLGWQSRGTLAMPRIHDMRHAFAVRRVQQWYEEGVSLDQAMFWLSTYLGHAKISDTYWYLTAVPELMSVAGQRFDHFAHDKKLENGL